MYFEKLKINLFANIFLILLVGLTGRLIIGSLVDFKFDFRGGDSGYYLEVARNILKSGVHGIGTPPEPAFFRAPLYSLFTAGVVYFFGESALAFFIVQSILTIALGLLIFFMLSSSNRTLAFFVAIMIVSSPSDILFNGRVLGESLVTFFLVLGVVQIYIAKTSFQFFIAGLLFALASLVRDVYILLPFFILAYYIFCRKQSKLLVFLLAGLLIGVGPWVFRNATQEQGGFFISKGASGYNLWVGTWERDPQWTIDQKFPDYAFSSDEEKRTINYSASNNDDTYMQNLALARLSDDFIGVVTTWVKRAPRLWIGTRSDLVTFIYAPHSVRWYFIKYIFFGLNIAILFGALLGLLLAIKKSNSLIIFAIPLIYTLVIYLPFHSTETRYSQPVYPIVFIFFVYFLVEFFPRLKERIN